MSPKGVDLVRDEKLRIDVPRGRPIDAAGIVRRFFTDGDDKALATERWVRDNMPHKIAASHSRVFWYDADVEQIMAIARRDNRKIKDVRLPQLVRVA